MLWLSRLCMFGSVACLGAAGWQYLKPEPGATLEVVNAVHDVGEIALEVETPTKIVVKNLGRQPKQILNVAPACGFSCCWRQAEQEPITVPPNGEAELTLLLKPTQPGSFAIDTALYLDDGFLRTIDLKITGRTPEHEPEAPTTSINK